LTDAFTLFKHEIDKCFDGAMKFVLMETIVYKFVQVRDFDAAARLVVALEVLGALVLYLLVKMIILAKQILRIAGLLNATWLPMMGCSWIHHMTTGSERSSKNGSAGGQGHAG
jgi:hypothetical protein